MDVEDGIKIKKQSNMENLNTLRIPLYKLYYADDVNNDNLLGAAFIKNFHEQYSQPERQAIFQAIEWALENPGFNFNSLLPGLRHTNEEITIYLLSLHNLMEANQLNN